MNSLTQETEQGNKISTRTDIFFNRLGIGQQLSSLKFRKIHGERPFVLIKYPIQMVWSNRSWYRLGRIIIQMVNARKDSVSSWPVGAMVLALYRSCSDCFFQRKKKLSLRYRSDPIRKCGRRTPNQVKNEKTRHPDSDSKQSQTDEAVLRLCPYGQLV